MPRKTHRSINKIDSIHLDQLPAKLLISVLSKMQLPSFTGCFYSSRWLLSFIQKNRKVINVQVKVEKLTVCASPDKIYIENYPKAISIEEGELCVFRPESVRIKGRYPDENGFLVKSNHGQFPETIGHLKRLGWLGTCVELDSFEEESLLKTMDSIIINGNPSKITIETNFYGKRWVYSRRVSMHPLLSKVPSVNFFSCSSPDLSFILSNHSTIQFECQEFTSLTTIQRLFKEMCDGSLQTKSVQVIHDGRIVPVDEILADLPHRLIWSSETRKENDLTKKYPRLSRLGPSSRFHSIPTKNGKIGGLYATGTNSGKFTFRLFESEEDFVHAMGTKTMSFLF